MNDIKIQVVETMELFEWWYKEYKKEKEDFIKKINERYWRGKAWKAFLAGYELQIFKDLNK